jgi:gamma-glutamyltranspeptidase
MDIQVGIETQGPTFLQHLALLEGFDLKQLGHNSADYLHVWLESAELASAGREVFAFRVQHHRYLAVMFSQFRHRILEDVPKRHIRVDTRRR